MIWIYIYAGTQVLTAALCAYFFVRWRIAEEGRRPIAVPKSAQPFWRIPPR